MSQGPDTKKGGSLNFLQNLIVLILNKVKIVIFRTENKK